MLAATPTGRRYPWLPAAVDPVAGIVVAVREVEVERGDPEVFVAAAQPACIGAYGFAPDAEITGSGAALDLAAAMRAAVGESLERYACCVIHPEELVVGSYREVRARGFRAVSPAAWALYAPHQRGQIPFPLFDEATRIAWVSGQDLLRREETLVPACLVYLGSRAQLLERGAHLVGPATSTGAACAPTLAEAALRGLYEVVERDAFVITWRNRLQVPRVLIDPHSTLGALIRERFDRPGLEYQAFWTTLDLQIPSFFGILCDRRRDPPAIVVGGAASLDPEAAVLKTFLECVQGLKWIDSLPPDPLPPEPGFRNVQSFTDRVRLYAFGGLEDAFQFLVHSDREVRLSEIPSLGTGSAGGDLARCLAILRGHGVQVIGLELTPSDVMACGLHVVKVLIPSCEVLEGDHRFPFLGGRRWREVPRQLGFAPTDPGDGSVLNPYPHPYP